MTVQSDLFGEPKHKVVDTSRRDQTGGRALTKSMAKALVPATRPPMQVAPRPPKGLKRVREAAARLGLSKSTLDKMRCDGRGPRFVKVTSKIVGYDPADLDAYAESRKQSSTSES